MRFQCELQLSYHKNPTYKPNKGKAYISLAKKTSQSSFHHNDTSPVHYLVVSSCIGSRLHDTRYKLDENILNINKKFCMHGMTTLKLLEPPHTLSISKAKPEYIQKLVRIIEMIQREEMAFSDEFEPLSAMRPIKLKDLKANPTSMNIYDKEKYPLTTLPQSLLKFTASNTKLFKFDLRLTRLKNLNELNLSSNFIKTLPDCINEMRLTSLILENNKLECLPEAFGTGLLANHLTLLDLSHNEISALRMEFYGFSELRTLDISSNLITELHPNLQLFQKIRDLILQSNQLKSIPISIYKLKNLGVLDLTQNPFIVEGVKSNHGNVSLPPLFELAFRKLKSNPKIIKLFRDNIPPLLLKKLDAGIQCACGRYFYNTFLTFYSRQKFDLRCDKIYLSQKSQITVEIPLCMSKCIKMVEQYKASY
ncbi:Leucine-rich repeat protein 1-like [Oopsacas minuta]|uniref:Leucine-rich repeat protein 1-like n=1 Tax=Oopsacas minuta TaxID=111878 RepID=A0AAV7JVS7_9METZ|nr:Leucine-rich repeat protein 1-like [Oopsacas minuta]